MSKKWTKWIEHAPEVRLDRPPMDGNEEVRVKLKSGFKTPYGSPRIAFHYDWGTNAWVSPITHYKRLKANVEAEMERDQNESARHKTAPPEPTPIITGPGEYKTRGEEKVTISGKGRAFGWLGCFQNSTNLTSWHDDGAYICASFPSHDIIGPWEEPEAEPEADLFDEITAELSSARSKFPGDNVTMWALVEEVGELSKAMFEEPRANVRAEAVQVAVMAIRVVLDGDHTIEPWRKSKGLDPLKLTKGEG